MLFIFQKGHADNFVSADDTNAFDLYAAIHYLSSLSSALDSRMEKQRKVLLWKRDILEQE